MVFQYIDRGEQNQISDPCSLHIVTCRVGHATNKTGSGSDDWIY
jgi:hypothetical protein